MSRRKKIGSLSFELLLLPLVLVLALAFSRTPLGHDLENLTLDWRFQLRAWSDPPAAPQVLVVGIDEDALEKLGRWPWQRSVHAQLMKLLDSRPPSAVAFDLLFTEASPDAEQDRLFGDALALSPASITAAMAQKLENAKKYEGELAGNTKAITSIQGDQSLIIGEDTGLLPVGILGESSHAGFVNSPPGPDGIRRQIPLIVRCGTHIFPSLVLQALLSHEGVESDAVSVVLGRSIRIQGAKKRWSIPIDATGQMTLNYRHPRTFSVFPYAALLGHLAAHQGQEWPAKFPPVKDQILFIGQTAAGLSDLGPTPHGPQTPLVLTHANALSNILSGDYIRQPDHRILIGIWVLLAFFTIIPVRFGPIWLAVLVPALFVGAYVYFAFHLFRLESLHLPLAWPVLGFLLVEGGSILHRLVIELRAKSRITNMFGTFLAPQVVKQLIASGEEPRLGGEQVEITAFFSDIAGFSSFSEKLTPERLVTLMNDYLTEMTDILHDNGGTLDKFIGDAIVGMFGAPLYFAGHAHSACTAALQMQKRQLELRRKWKHEGGWPDIVHQMQTRIGLNSGLAVIGNMGSRRRFNYTMMGDTVNLAARSESGAKSYGVYTMITGETKALAQKHRDDITYRFLDRIVVKGRSQPAEVYELVGFTNEISPETEECLHLFEKGVAAYQSQRWDAAIAFFERSARREIHQDSNPSLVMKERCEVMKIHPPPADWDGVYVMKTK
ncbi:CHASE2 domain-containing protein [Prosthecobacter fluviatilis]|uniref:CHASE2 domain-containing protein n=1 Tax=Prosthecobacter fluviatilis TaxID=445931 RepID=A0ABW0KU61_9BACT